MDKLKTPMPEQPFRDDDQAVDNFNRLLKARRSVTRPALRNKATELEFLKQDAERRKKLM